MTSTCCLRALTQCGAMLDGRRCAQHQRGGRRRAHERTPQCAVAAPPAAERTATTRLQRNKNIEKLKAGYLFPEVKTSQPCLVLLQ